MTIASIPVSEGGSTAELQAWLDAHPTVTINRIFTLNNYVYVMYE